MDTIIEYEAGIENSDYDEIDDMFVKFLGECSVNPLSVDDFLIEFLGSAR